MFTTERAEINADTVCRAGDARVRRASPSRDLPEGLDLDRDLQPATTTAAAELSQGRYPFENAADPPDRHESPWPSSRPPCPRFVSRERCMCATHSEVQPSPRWKPALASCEVLFGPWMGCRSRASNLVAVIAVRERGPGQIVAARQASSLAAAFKPVSLMHPPRRADSLET